MELHTILNTVGNVLIVWAALVGVASVVVHLRVFDRRSRMSVHLCLYMIIIAAVLVLSCIRIFLGDSAWFQFVRLIVFVGVPLVMTQRLVLQVQAQRVGRGAAETRRPDTSDSPAHPGD